MQNMFKRKITMSSEKSRLSNMSTVHTSSIGTTDLVLPVVLLHHNEFVKLTCDVIGGTSVRVPRRIHIVARAFSVVFHLLLAHEIPIKALPTMKHGVTRFLAQLTDRFGS
jgi:hypothetical protein